MLKTNNKLKTISTTVFILTSIVIALNPFPHTTTIYEISYYLALVLTIFYLSQKRELAFLHNPLTVPVAIFTLWAFIGLFGALDIQTSIHDFNSHLLKYIALFAMLVTFTNTSKRLKILAWLVVISVTISSISGLYTFYIQGGHHLSQRFILSDPEYPVGPVGVMAMFALLFGLTLFRIEKNSLMRFGLSICLVILAVTVFAVQSRAIMLAMPLVFVVMFWGNKKLLVIFLITALGAGFFTMEKFRGNPVKANYSPRLTINYIAFLVFKEHPVKGIGFGINTFGNPKFIDHEAYRKKVPKSIRNPTVVISSPHNMYMSMAVRSGLPGLLMYIYILYVALKMCVKVISCKGNNFARLWGYCLGSCLILLIVYGFFDVVFLKFLEILLCLSFSTVSICYTMVYEKISPGLNEPEYASTS
ncbi:O-antigen ligase family protein [Desulfobacterota bacterium M19]